MDGLVLAERRHRLAGNFQLLQALIAIRLRSVEDAESRRHLGWLTDMIAALALINARLGAGASDFDAYLAESISFWRRIDKGRALVFECVGNEVRIPEAKEGLHLIRGLAEHLKGKVEIVSDGGLAVTVRIPLDTIPPARARRPH